jgi:hypothetical protein
LCEFCVSFREKKNIYQARYRLNPNVKIRRRAYSRKRIAQDIEKLLEEQRAHSASEENV